MKHTLIQSIKTTLLGIIIVFLIFSCTDSAPEISRVYYTLVYDFIEENLPPQVRMSVFIEPLSDKRRVKEMVLYNRESDYTWYINNPLTINDGDVTYFGHHDIVYPQNADIKAGKYEITFYDLAMRDTNSFFDIEKIPSLKEVTLTSLTASGFRSKQFAEECAVEQITIYDILANVLYTGSRTEEIDSDDKLRALFPAAMSYRLFYKNQDNSTVIILPEVQLYEPQDADEDEDSNE